MAIFDERWSPIPVKSDEPKLNCSKDKFQEWVTSQGQINERPNFNTEIFFLTLYAHNISVVSVISKALRRIRVIKELNRNIEDLRKSENNWKVTPAAERYRNLLKKFQIKVKVSRNLYFINTKKKEIGKKYKVYLISGIYHYKELKPQFYPIYVCVCYILD